MEMGRERTGRALGPMRARERRRRKEEKEWRGEREDRGGARSHESKRKKE